MELPILELVRLGGAHWRRADGPSDLTRLEVYRHTLGKPPDHVLGHQRLLGLGPAAGAVAARPRVSDRRCTTRVPDIVETSSTVRLSLVP